MKKSVKLLCLCLAAMILLSLFGCAKKGNSGTENSDHEHSYAEWSVAKEPSCSEKGEEQRICSVCGKAETKEIETTEHNYSRWLVKKEATELEEGLEYRACVNCRHEEERSVPILEKEVKYDKYKGMTFYCYGDSLTWYDGQNATWGAFVGQQITGYETYIREEFDATVVNKGFSGFTIPEICKMIKGDEGLMKNVDVVIISGGDNDDRVGTEAGELMPYGSKYDTDTTTGALQSAIEKILKASPETMVVLMTEPMGWKFHAETGRLERVDECYPNAIRAVAEYYGLPLIDLWAVGGVNEMTRDLMYLDPPASVNTEYMYHPSNYGWKVLSERIVGYLKTLK